MNRQIVTFVPAFALAASLTSHSAVRAAEPSHLATIRFPSSGATLTGPERAKLDRVAARLKTGNLAAVRLVGHTDRHGNPIANQRLGLRRAEAVKRLLVAGGVPQDRIWLESAGEYQLLDVRQTSAADALNRRVEIWVATRNAPRFSPPAWVSWIHRDVQTQKSKEPEWRAAELNQPLNALDRVRTLQQSAGELTFRNLDRLRLSSDALVVIYRDPARPKQTKRPLLEDVRLEQGALLARVAEEDRRLRVRSPTARVDVTSKRTRVEHSPRHRASTVSVYQGRARVAAAGERVGVQRGFGTRIKQGQKPETPTPLPAPPEWLNSNPVVVIGDRTPPLALRRTATASIAIVQLSRRERGRERVIRRLISSEDFVQLTSLAPGRYGLQLQSQDAKRIVGAEGPARPLVVLPPRTVTATLGAAEPPTWDRLEDGTIALSAPGVVEIAVPEGIVLTSTHGQVRRGTWRVEAGRPGRFEFPFALHPTGREWQEEGQLAVIVRSPPPPPPMQLAAPAPPPEQPPPSIPADDPPLATLAVRGGVAIPDSGDLAPTILVDLSGRLPLSPRLALQLGAELGWSQTKGTSNPSSATAVRLWPMRVRSALQLNLGQDHVYFGAAGGMLLASGSLEPVDGDVRRFTGFHPSWRAFAGFARALPKFGEVYVELGGAPLLLNGEPDLTQNRLQILAGARLGAW